MSRHPNLLWAQRSDRVYITIELPDAQDVNIKLKPDGQFHFSANRHVGDEKIPYEIDITLYDKIVVEESKYVIGSRNIRYLVKKANKKWWSRLLREGGRRQVFIAVDWNKWIDEDDEKEEKFSDEMDFGEMDFSKLNMGENVYNDSDAKDAEEMEESDAGRRTKAEGATSSH